MQAGQSAPHHRQALKELDGATGEIGLHPVDGRVHVHDLHATILHLLGLDHEKLAYRYSGRTKP